MDLPVVAIIGGGLAGLAAAARVRDSGIARPVILEAADFIGGRVRQSDDGEVELG